MASGFINLQQVKYNFAVFLFNNTQQATTNRHPDRTFISIRIEPDPAQRKSQIGRVTP